MKSKKVKRIAIGTAIVAVLVAAVLGILTAFGINLFSCSKNSGPSDAPETTVNISSAPPTDGSLPTAHTGIENISYMVYVLDNQESWHSYSDTDSIAAGGINNQKTYTYKDYKNGVLIASDMTYSSFVQSSTQTAYIGDGAYARTGSKPSKTTAITEIEWNDGEPEYLERQSYYEKYGLFADEISVFLLNEETISSYGEVTENEDGTYTQSFTLDPVASSYYYQYNMYTRGGLSSYPAFTTVNLTFTFNSDWEVLEVQTYEVADVSMGVISTTNTSESHITYTYGDDCIDEYNYAFYESYFKQYVGNVAEGNSSATDSELSVTEVLQYGFGEVLSGGKQYAMDIVVGDTAYTGYIYASVDLNTLSVDTLSAMEIRLSLGKTVESQDLYIELSNGDIAVYYSDSFAVSGSLSELSLMIDQLSALFGTDGGTQTVALTDAQNSKTLLSKTTIADESDDDDVLTQLLSIIEVVETDGGATLSIKTDDLLGTGIGIDMTMEFAKDDTNVLTFTNASVRSLSYGGETLSVSVTLSETEAEVITRNEEMTPANLSDFVANVYELLSSDLLELSIKMDGSSSDYAALDGLSVEASALLDINSVVVGADLYVNYAAEGGSLSAKIKAYYNYSVSEYGDIYLYLYELDGKAVDVKLYCDISELADAITVLLGSETEDADEVAEEISQSVAQIINSVLALDFSKVITQLYSSGSSICLGVDLDTIMTLLGASGLPRLGTAALVYDGNELALTLAALGLSIDLGKAAGAIEEPDVSEYVDLTKLINEIYSLISSDTFNLVLSLDGSGENCTITRLSGLSVNLEASFDMNSLVLGSAAEVSYTSGESVISAKLNIYYVYNEEDYGTVYVYLYDICGKQAEVKLRADISDISELAEGLVSGVTESVDLSSEESLELAEILEAVVAFDFSSAITVLSATSTQIKLGLDVDGILSRFGVDFEGIGAVELTYVNGAFAVTAENLGLSASLSGGDGEVTAPDDAEEYLDISEIVAAVNGIIKSDTVTAEITLSGSGISYLEDVALEGTVNYTIESGILEVDLTASYKNINVMLTAYYDGEAVYLYISELAGAETEVKVTCTVEDLSEVLEKLLSDEDNAESGGLTIAVDNVLETLLAIDYGAVITELKANAEDGIILGLDIDGILEGLQVDLGLELGAVVINFNGGELTVAAEYAGLSASVSGSDGAVSLPADAADYMDIIAAAKDIYAVVKSNIINIEVGIDGGELLNGFVDSAYGEYLEGVAIEGNIKIATSDYSVLCDLELTYEYNGEGVSLGIQAYYDGTTVYLLIDEINGAAASIGVSCDIETLPDALAKLTSLINGGEAEDNGEGGGEEQAAADIVAILLAMDYSTIIDELKTGADSLTLAVNVDSVLSQLAASGIISESIASYTFGSISLEYSGGEIKLAANGLGLEASLCGESGTISKPAANYLTVESVLELIESVKAKVAEIQAAKSVYFDIECYLTSDELTLGVEGSGEVDWSGETATIALDLTLSIRDGSSNPDKINVKLLYSADGTITLVVGSLGITATADEISGLQDGFEELLEAILTLAGVSGDSLENSQTVSSAAEVDVASELNSLLLNGDLADILTVLLDKLSSEKWVEKLADFTLSVDGASAMISCIDGYALTFTADDGFALTMVSQSGNENKITVSAGIGYYATVKNSINESASSGDCTIMSADDNAKLTEVIYNFGLGVISNASIANTLGTDTYTIDLALYGDNTGVDALAGVTVNATLYYTDTVTTSSGEVKTESKLCEMDVDIDVSGVTAVFNIFYYDESLYITLTEINGTQLGDLKMTVELGDVYAIADQLVEVLLNPNLSTFIANFTSSGDEDGDSGVTVAAEQTEVSGEEATILSETLVTLLSLDFSKIIGSVKTEENGTETRSVWVNIDEIYKAFADGETLGLGTVTASVITTENGEGNTDRAIEITGVYNEAVWLSASAGKASARDYSDFDETEYWDLAFVNDFINDAINFATNDNGEFYDMYTFSGTLTAGINLGSLVGDIGIEIEVLNLTIGFNDGGFYLSMLGNLSQSSAIGFTISEGYTIGLTYSNGYITLGRKLGTSGAEFKIVSISYFTDYLLESESPLRWLLGTSQSLWNMIISAVDADLSSGVTDVDTLNLTTGSGQTSTTLDEFYLSDYITGINAVIGGETVTSSGDNYAASQLGLTKNYYAFDFNNEVLASLTGDGITELYAAILRSDEQGISGLTACGKVGGVLDFNLTLGEYLEGVTQVYDVTATDGTATYEAMDAGDVTADNMFTMVESPAESDFASYYVYDEDSESYVLASDNGGEFSSEATYYVPVYYIPENGSYVQATVYDENATYYAISYVTAIKGFAAPDMWTQLTEYLAAKGVTINYADTYTDEYTVIFGCYDYALGDDSGTTTSQYAPQSFTLYVYIPDENGNYGEEPDQTYTLKYGSTVNAVESENLVTVNGNPGKYVYYYYAEDGETKVYVGESFTFGGDTTIYAEFRNQVTVNYYNKYDQKIYTLTSYEGNDIVIPDGYTLLGDMEIVGNDESTEIIAIRGAQGREIEISGEFVVTEYKVNGVIYTYNTTDGYYHISGTYAGGYTGSVLVLENEFDGYAVGAIDAGALSGAINDGGNLSMVTTVIVPENITVIGGRSFYDCEYLQTIVFLADTITLETDGTTSGLGSDHGYPFYDCSSTLIVYYNNLDSSVDSGKCFSYYEYWFTYSPVQTQSGGWIYIDGAIKCDEEENAAITAINNYLTENAISLSGIGGEYDIAALEAALQSAVNAYTLANGGYVGYYKVAVTYSASESGRYIYDLTIGITENDGKYYALNISSDDASVTINGDRTYEYGGITYYLEDSSIEITVTEKQGRTFTGYSVTVGDNKTEYTETDTTFTFYMGNGVTTLAITCEVDEVKIFAYSEVSYTYSFNNQTIEVAGSSESTQISVVNGDAITDYTLTATESGYYFLGWAQVVNGELVFIGSEVTAAEELEVYAIWAYSSQSLTGYTVATSGASLVTDLTSSGGTFYKWYADSAFTTEITEITTANTVVYARWQFSMDFNFSEGNSKLIVDGSTYASDTSTLTCTYSVSVLEGYYVTVEYSKGSYKYSILTKYYTIVTVTVYDGEGGSSVESHTMYLNKADNNNGDRYLSISGISSNWSGTTSGSSLTSGSAYATINGYTYISY